MRNTTEGFLYLVLGVEFSKIGISVRPNTRSKLVSCKINGIKTIEVKLDSKILPQVEFDFKKHFKNYSVGRSISGLSGDELFYANHNSELEEFYFKLINDLKVD